MFGLAKSQGRKCVSVTSWTTPKLWGLLLNASCFPAILSPIFNSLKAQKAPGESLWWCVCVGLGMCNKLWAVSRQQLSFWLSPYLILNSEATHIATKPTVTIFFLGRGVNVWALSKREFNISWLSVEYFFLGFRIIFFFSITFSSYNIRFWGFACCCFFFTIFPSVSLSHPSIHLFSSTYSIQARKGLEPIPAATVWGCQSVTEFEFIFDNVLFFLAFLSPFLFLAFFVSLRHTLAQ